MKPSYCICLSQISHDGGDIKPPGDEESRSLARRAKTGDRNAIDELVTRNTPMVAAMIRKFGLEGTDLQDDAFQNGCIGLMHAIRTFDPDHLSQASFVTHAWNRVFAAMQHTLKKNRKRIDHEVSGTTLVESEIVEKALDDYHSKSMQEAVLDCANLLPARVRSIVLDWARGGTLSELGRTYGVSKQRIAQIRNQGLDMIASAMMRRNML
jgi:RNA polymerase sigma factor (sigma-70 family)